jgi:hypothetical protein
VGQGHEVHRDLVDVELFVIEAHALHLIGHGGGSLQAIAMSNHTATRPDDPGEGCEMKCVRGADAKQSSMQCLLSPEDVVPRDHPLRAIKGLVESVLQEGLQLDENHRELQADAMARSREDETGPNLRCRRVQPHTHRARLIPTAT